MNQTEFANSIGITKSWMSQILSGEAEMGKATAKKIGKRVGRQWNEVIAMDHEALRAMIEAHLED